MKKQQLINKLEQAWSDFQASYVDLPEARMTEPGVIEDWSVKDIMAHVSWWEAEALKYLPDILRGIHPPRYSEVYGGIDAFNAQMMELKRGLSLDEVKEQMDETHAKLMELISGVPEEEFATETRFRHRLRLDTYSHYPIHTQAIRQWREQRS